MSTHRAERANPSPSLTYRPLSNSSIPRGPRSSMLTRRQLTAYIGLTAAAGGIAALIFGLVRYNKISFAWMGRWAAGLSNTLGLTRTEL